MRYQKYVLPNVLNIILIKKNTVLQVFRALIVYLLPYIKNKQVKCLVICTISQLHYPQIIISALHCISMRMTEKEVLPFTCFCMVLEAETEQLARI